MIRRSLISSTLDASTPPSPPAPANPAASMATFSRAKNLSSTLRSWRRGRSELLPQLSNSYKTPFLSAAASKLLQGDSRWLTSPSPHSQMNSNRGVEDSHSHASFPKRWFSSNLNLFFHGSNRRSRSVFFLFSLHFSFLYYII